MSNFVSQNPRLKTISLLAS